MAAVPKSQVLLVSRDELVSCDVRGAALLTQLVGTEAVEGVAVGVVFVVMVNGVGRDFDVYAGGDGLAVGEGEGDEDFAVEGGCEI